MADERDTWIDELQCNLTLDLAWDETDESERPTWPAPEPDQRDTIPVLPLFL